MILFCISFSADIDYPFLEIEFGGKAFVDEKGTLQAFYIMEPYPNVNAISLRSSRKYFVGFKLYGLPLTFKTKPILEGRIGPVSFPMDKVVMPLEWRTQNGASALQLARGRYVLELSVTEFRYPPVLKAIFFTVDGEWLCSLGRNRLCDAIAERVSCFQTMNYFVFGILHTSVQFDHREAHTLRPQGELVLPHSCRLLSPAYLT